ncbi:cupin-like domain-containing protein [Pseudomonas sp. LJDD11]|uniref:JmjC domain-containing protein n=1 Tax=unclassified Pseudomonas TaxID=196821 RepID=UPI0004F77857|nr:MULTISPECIES: cupin domain-containing protein [unclassified Pseudomonas]MCQ9427025.1 cupin-like domain-containing protein [Pseudomonas sp. LJDD11]BAP44941.1 cupin 4 family protein [Pseudomonas sp. StFLB209]
MNMNFGLSAAEFAAQYQEKKPLLIKGAVEPGLFDWDEVNQIFERSDVASHDFKLSCDGIRPKHEYVESYWDIGTLRQRLIKPVVYDYLRQGATLIANKIANEPRINHFSRQVAQFTGRQVVNSAYAAFGTRDSFRAHWDTRDVFAIQLIGRKRWIVYEPTFAAPLFTQQSKDYEHLYPCPETPYMDFVMEAGDVFYLPRGWWHNPLPLGEPTFHLALGTFPAYTMDYLGWVMQQLPQFVQARQSLSDWSNDQPALADVGRLIDGFINDPHNYQRFMDEFTGALRVESPLAIEVFGDPANLQLDDQTRLRLSAQRVQGLGEGYVIANGARLVLDEQGVQLIRLIIEHPGISLAQLRAAHPGTDAARLHRLVADLCQQDVLERVRD